MSYSVGKILKTIIKKQGLFLIGSTLIIFTWYFQNFIIEAKNQKMNAVELARNKFNEILTRIEINKAQLLQIDLVDYTSANTKSFDSYRLPLFSDQFINIYYSKFAAMDIDPDYNDDALDKAYERIPNLDVALAICNTKDMEKIAAEYKTEVRNFEDLQQKVTYSYTTQIIILKDKDKNIHFYAVLLFILGTILISANKAIEYLESVKHTLVSK
jgi:hypothetical protein